MTPNPSIERTSHGGSTWRASSRSAAPWVAAHVERAAVQLYFDERHDGARLALRSKRSPTSVMSNK